MITLFYVCIIYICLMVLACPHLLVFLVHDLDDGQQSCFISARTLP